MCQYAKIIWCINSQSTYMYLPTYFSVQKLLLNVIGYQKLFKTFVTILPLLAGLKSFRCSFEKCIIGRLLHCNWENTFTVVFTECFMKIKMWHTKVTTNGILLLKLFWPSVRKKCSKTVKKEILLLSFHTGGFNQI